MGMGTGRSTVRNLGLVLLLTAGCEEPDGAELAPDAELPGDTGQVGGSDAAGPDGSDGSLQSDDASVLRPDAYTLPPEDASGTESSVAPCQPGAGSDRDSDGFAAPVDCNDCDPSINPAAFDVAKNGLDDDCSGGVDDEPQLCDAQLGDSSDDARVAARALGLCRQQTGESWGLVDAKWVFPDGTVTSKQWLDCPAGRPPLSHQA